MSVSLAVVVRIRATVYTCLLLVCGCVCFVCLFVIELGVEHKVNFLVSMCV